MHNHTATGARVKDFRSHILREAQFFFRAMEAYCSEARLHAGHRWKNQVIEAGWRRASLLLVWERRAFCENPETQVENLAGRKMVGPL